MLARHVSTAALIGVFALALLPLGATPASGQWTAGKRGSDNIDVVAHVPLGAWLSVSDVEIEQDLSRPYAYVGREVFGEEGEKGLDIIDLHDPENAKRIFSWRIENQDLHLGAGGKDIKIFQWQGRHYIVLSTQFGQGGPNADLGAIVFDVTGLPDVSTVKEVARIAEPDLVGGFHNIYVYKHTNSRVLMFATVSGPFAHVYDLGHAVEGHLDEALVATVPVPDAEGGRRGYHDFYAAYHPDSSQDRFYGGGTGGYYVYDITDLEEPELLVSLTGIRGVQRGHTFTPTPDGRYVIGESEYQYAPLRIYDLKPGLDGEVENISKPIGAWTADWKNLVHNHEVRWPYVFVSGYLDGLQVFNIMDPANPVTVAYYDTFIGPPNQDITSVFNGAWGVDVRNADGLIVVSDMSTGFWAFHMEGFQGWNGEDWGMPNISSVQDWEAGPAGTAGTEGTDGTR